MSITVSGISETLNLVERYNNDQGDMAEKIHLVLEKLARIGVSVAWTTYTASDTDGNDYFDVDWYETGENSVCVVARGEQILFLEFGTGARFAQPYPTDEDFKPIFKAGDWSKLHSGKWDNPKGWWYTDNSGNTGNHTYGIPPARGMYEAKKEIRNNVDAVIREVFG